MRPATEEELLRRLDAGLTVLRVLHGADTEDARKEQTELIRRLRQSLFRLRLLSEVPAYRSQRRVGGTPESRPPPKHESTYHTFLDELAQKVDELVDGVKRVLEPQFLHDLATTLEQELEQVEDDPMRAREVLERAKRLIGGQMSNNRRIGREQSLASPSSARV